jgi:hypothetical protein
LTFGDAACVALLGFHSPRFVFVAGCGWRLWSVFVFWRSGASALTGVSFVFCFGGSAPSVLLLFLLAAAVDFCPLMLLLLVFLFWCPVASACPGVSFFWWLCLVFVVWRSGLSGASARPGVFVFFPEWLWFVFGVCLLAFWGFCSPGVSFVFFVLVVLPVLPLPHLFCFSSCWRLRLIFVL